LNYRHKAPTKYYVVEYEHTYYNHTHSTRTKAVYFTLESAQEASLKMMKRGQHIHSVHEEKLLNKPEILEIRREGTP
jgi:hypothetical protein